MQIVPLCGSDLNVPRNQNYLVVETDNPRIVFSYSQKGKAITAHFACPPESRRHIKPAINAFCEWVFLSYGWCKMIFACTEYSSIGRIIRKCGFKLLDEFNECDVYVKERCAP